MNLLSFYRSTIGKKLIMAVSGLIGVAFLVLHMVGNLQIFVGPDRINNYARFLHGPAAEGVLALRVILVVALVLHVWMAFQLTRINRAARPVAYERRVPQVTTLASRTLRWGGVFLLVFIVLHILHFTTLDLDPTFVELDVFGNALKAFNSPWMVAFYTVAMLLLGFHLYHGVWSSGRTMGVSKPVAAPLRRRIALVLATVIALGFAAVPLAIWFGVVP